VHDDPKSSPVHYPSDRRFRIRIGRPFLLLFFGIVVVPVAVAWGQYLIAGLPLPPDHSLALAGTGSARPFPGWVRLAHYMNFLFMVLLARSGLSILMDHPRLYWNEHCTPGTGWLQFTPIDVPLDRVWTAKDDARYISPWLGLPGYRHTIGVARHWHLVSALFWFLNGILFIVLLFCSEEWKRLVPASGEVFQEAWVVFVHYATFHMPPEPDPLVRYNSLQQLSYFGVVFGMAPLSVLTGLAMSPAIDNRFRWYPKLFGGRQAARSIHFILLTGYIAFLVMHVAMVFLTNPIRNMNIIVFGSSDGHWTGLITGLAAIGLVALICFFAHWLSWNRPRVLQYAVRRIHGVMRRLFFEHWEPRVRYSKEEISPYFWANGKQPTSEEWESLAAGGFEAFRLRVSGLIENPVELSLADLKAMGKQEQITMHHCIQGWSGIAQWGGLPMARLVELVRPAPDAKVVVFHSFGDGLFGGNYYDTQPMEVALLEETLLAYEMNFEPLPLLYGAPLRLRVESQLGYKMVKWISAIEFVASEKTVGKGHGGKNEDDEYFDLIPEI
jgi:DMSO/TMAO reductase YedYZ molybdopterin-dependent catalytic subunit/thiosulfate reductase cytochrome b subunit